MFSNSAFASNRREIWERLHDHEAQLELGLRAPLISSLTPLVSLYKQGKTIGLSNPPTTTNQPQLPNHHKHWCPPRPPPFQDRDALSSLRPDGQIDVGFSIGNFTAFCFILDRWTVLNYPLFPWEPIPNKMEGRDRHRTLFSFFFLAQIYFKFFCFPYGELK